MPAVLLPIPPAVILVPATLPLCVEIVAALFGLVAVFTVLTNCLVQPGLSFFDSVLALGMIIGGIRPLPSDKN